METVRVKKRLPLNALVLSLIMPGLGHIYCGRIVKGLMLAFLNSIFIPVILYSLMADAQLKMLIIGMSLFGILVIWLVAIIDSFYLAKHTKQDYELKDYNRWYVYLLLIFISAGGSTEISLQIKSNYFEAFRVPTASNFPTITPNDRIIADKTIYHNSNPQKGDLIVYINPEDPSRKYLGRIIAVGGDTVELKNNELFINDQILERQKLQKAKYECDGKICEGDIFCEINGTAKYKIFLDKDNFSKSEYAKIEIPKNYCFILGDNRNRARDSRFFGPIQLATIVGKAQYLYFPAKDWLRFGKIQ